MNTEGNMATYPHIGGVWFLLALCFVSNRSFNSDITIIFALGFLTSHRTKFKILSSVRLTDA